MECGEQRDKRVLSPSPSESSSDDSESSKKRKKEKKREKREKKRRKKEKKRQRKEQKRQRKLESERAGALSEHKRAAPTSAVNRPHTSLLGFMQPLSTGYSSDRKYAHSSAYKGFEGKNAYDKELEQRYQHSWGSEAGRESKLQAMVREEAAAEREKQRRRR